MMLQPALFLVHAIMGDYPSLSPRTPEAMPSDLHTLRRLELGKKATIRNLNLW
jgi:hypothetical protein